MNLLAQNQAADINDAIQSLDTHIPATNEEKEFCKISSLITAARSMSEEEEGAFLAFLRYCAERLGSGDSVQEIWNDFLEKAQRGDKYDFTHS